MLILQNMVVLDYTKISLKKQHLQLIGKMSLLIMKRFLFLFIKFNLEKFTSLPGRNF